MSNAMRELNVRFTILQRQTLKAGENWMNFMRKSFKTVRKAYAKASSWSSEFMMNMNKLSPARLTRAQLRDRGYEMIGSPVMESSSHTNPFKFGFTSVGGNATWM